MESLSVDTIPAGVPEDAVGAAFPRSAAGGFCCAPAVDGFGVPFTAGFVPVLEAAPDDAFGAFFAVCFCGACFATGSGAAAVSISSRLHSGMWADALQERSRGYSGCLE